MKSANRIVMAAALATLVSAFALGCSTGGSAPSAAGADAVSPDPQVQEVIANSCFDCHSDRGSAPWNARFAPTYWFGHPRKVLDFSHWQSYDAGTRTALLAAIASDLREGTMPPGDYTFFRPSTKLSDRQQQSVIEWATRPAALPAH